jgi:hypothetical protein
VYETCEKVEMEEQEQEEQEQDEQEVRSLGHICYQNAVFTMMIPVDPRYALRHESTHKSVMDEDERISEIVDVCSLRDATPVQCDEVEITWPAHKRAVHAHEQPVPRRQWPPRPGPSKAVDEMFEQEQQTGVSVREDRKVQQQRSQEYQRLSSGKQSRRVDEQQTPGSSRHSSCVQGSMGSTSRQLFADTPRCQWCRASLLQLGRCEECGWEDDERRAADVYAGVRAQVITLSMAGSTLFHAVSRSYLGFPEVVELDGLERTGPLIRYSDGLLARAEAADRSNLVANLRNCYMHMEVGGIREPQDRAAPPTAPSYVDTVRTMTRTETDEGIPRIPWGLRSQQLE